MKRLLTFYSCLVLCLCGISTFAASDRIKLTLTVTNLLVTGDTLTVNSDARYATNTSGATYFSTNELPNVTTNLYNHLLSYPFANNLILLWSSPTTIVFRAQTGGDLTASEAGDWASLVLSTQTVQRASPVTVPIGNQPTATQATNIISQLVSDLSGYSTNAFATNATALAGYVPTNGVFFGNIVSAPSITGTVSGLTNGIYITPALSSPTLTNGINYGDAFSSPGGGAGSEQFGTGAGASGSHSLAVGNAAESSGDYSISVGDSGTVASDYSVLIGVDGVISSGSDYAVAIGFEAQSDEYSIAIGAQADASGSNSIAIGLGADATHDDSVVFGNGGSSTMANEVVLGNSDHTVTLPGNLSAATQTNSTFKGTNIVKGDWSWEQNAVTSIAAGNNVLTPGYDKTHIYLSGTPGAAFTIASITNWTPGKMLIIENNTGFAMTIADESGFDSTAANRIVTPGGEDVTLSGRNTALLTYNGTSSRWVLVHPTADDAVEMYGSMTVIGDETLDLAVQSTYYQITNYDAIVTGNMTSSSLGTEGSLTNTYAGIFNFDLTMSFDGTAQAADDYQAAVFTNGVECTLIEWKRTTSSAATGSAAAGAIIALPAGVRIDYRIQNDGDDGEIIIKHANLKVHSL